MCGIAGVVGPPELAREEAAAAMARTLEHRGPDDFGTWHALHAAAGRPLAVAFGHTRLSILDLSPLGRQPMASRDGVVVVSFNGEIYNFRELRDELRAGGVAFRSECDTEVLLEAYRAWGSDAFARLIGMFAFALWDGARGRLLLVRDRLGIKPLFYQHAGGLLLFGSELRALRAHPRFEPRIDRGALGRYLRHGYTSGAETIYAESRRLPPGEMLAFEDGKIERTRYWQLTDPPETAPPATFEGAVDALDEALGDAVERRLIADVPIGAFLSGGVDSSAVVALMRERARGPVRTFSIGFEDEAFDESPHARAVARHLGTEHTELTVRRAQAVEVAHELPALYDEPFADASAIPTTLLSRLTRRHVTVALSGDGGDELFGGYAHYAKLRRLLPLLAAPPALRRAAAALAPAVPFASLRNGLRHLRAADACGLAESLLSHFDPELLRAACGDEGARPGALFRETFRAAPSDDPVRRAMYADARVYLADDILTKVDRASMSVALEVRVPILDHRVARLALSLPDAHVWRGGRAKAPLRALVYRRVPASLIERPKHGFGIPIHTLLAKDLRAWTARYLAPERLAEEGHFEPAGVQGLLAAATGREPIAITRLWFLICFERWFARTHRGEAA